MNTRHKVLILLAILTVLALPTAVYAQDEPETNTFCNPVATYLAEELDVDCQVILDYQNQDTGLGQVMMALRLSRSLPNFDGSWEDLLARKQAGEGWGQIMMAYRLAGASGLSAEEMLALKESGIGWGQIMKASAIARSDLGLTFDEALALFQSGAGWGEIREELGLPPGPPPWAGGPNKWNNGEDRPGNGRGGPPPWAGGPHNTDGDEDNGGGPPWGRGSNNGQGPPWAGNDDAEGDNGD
jgi:hypothetical protein